ncbi:MAG: efflux RND transporter permease subunit [Myxococcota bacterium]
MTLSDVSINRPILTWMMMLALVVFGVLGFRRLGVDQYPNMEFPVLTVLAELDGASPEGIEEDVTDVIEEKLNTIAGVRSIRSTSSQGFALITVEFALGKDIALAAQEVRDKVARARRELPEELEPPTVDTFDPSSMAILWVPFLTDRTAVDTSEYVRRTVRPVFETIPGVAGVTVFGRRDRNLRIWLDGEALRARGLAASDALRALQSEHIEVPGGLVESRLREYTVKTEAEFQSVAALEQLVVAFFDGAPVQLRDVARVEDGSEDLRAEAHYNGEISVGLGIQKQSGGNTVAIVDEVKRRIGEIRAILPSGITIDEEAGFIDFSHTVREAVAETLFSLAFGALLAVFTVFVFLRRGRPTLIIAVSLPISLIATFGLVWLAGYTLNTMTLLGMALAVGVVIDDAIIVLENIERHREAGEAPRQAAEIGARQIAFAATAATASVIAVFLPVVFVEGIIGSFLGEFGLTVAGSVGLSLFVALTLTPMLASRMGVPRERAHGGLYHKLENAQLALESHYTRALEWTLAHRAATLGLALASFAAAIAFASQLSTEFFPPSDEGIFMVRTEAPQGTVLDVAREFLKHDEAWMLAQPEVAGLFSAVGLGNGPNMPGRPSEGMMFATLRPLDERTRSVHELMDAGRAELGRKAGRDIRIFNPGSMMRSGGGSRMGQFEVELRGNLSLHDLDEVSDEFMAALAAHGGFVDLNKSLKLGLPELRVIPDRERAAALGIDARSLATTVQLMIGGLDVGVFKEAGHRYDIRMRLEEKDRNDPDAIGRLYVRTRTGDVVEMNNLVQVQQGAAPSAITRSGRQRSVTVAANLDSGLVLGDAIEAARGIAKRVLPEGVTLVLSGQAEAMQEGASQAGVALLLGLLVIYMVLAAQFESLVHPFTVMVAVPLAMTGALGGLLVTGQTLNLFSLIGILLLFGLVTKNSILLVDYANQLRAEGMGKVEAMRKAAPVRMRPVVMTAVAMIFGVLPAAIGIGPGAETRRPMAIAAGAGMLSSTVLTLLVVPVFYLAMDDAVEWLKASVRRLVYAVSGRRTGPAV